MAADPHLLEMLRKVLALTTSPVEGEAQAAAHKLQEILTKHNLSLADVERRGQKVQGVREQSHDLGKAAFQWKLDLANSVAEHYFCVPLVDTRKKTVAFVGRPDNVESLTMLYQWLIDQIKRLSTETWRENEASGRGHVDPLRWQLSFGLGAVDRLQERLVEWKAQQAADNATRALVVNLSSENSDYLEEKYGYRRDGQPTKREREWQAEREAEQKRKADLKARDLNEFYRQYPWERPETPEQKAKRAAEDAAWYAKQERAYAAKEKRRARSGYSYRPDRTDYEKLDQQSRAERSGRKAADKVNLQPFVGKGKDAPKKEIGG